MLARNSLSNGRVGRNVIITSLVARLAGAVKPRTPRMFGALALSAAAVVVGAIGLSEAQGAPLLLWRTDGTTGQTWTGLDWSNPATTTGGTGWTLLDDAEFSANSTLTFATTDIGNVTVDDGKTVTITQAGTMNTGAGAAQSTIHTFTIGTGSTLTWTGQNVSNNSANGFIKDGAGTWSIGAQGNNYTGGFTLNAGTVIVSGAKSLGTAALTINGGTIQSSGGTAYAPTSITIGGNFTNTGTGTASWAAPITLSAVDTITNSTTSGNRNYSGSITAPSTGTSGLTFNGSGAGGMAITGKISGAATSDSMNLTFNQTASAGVINVQNDTSDFTGTISFLGGETGFGSNGSFGNANNAVVIDGGRFTAEDSGSNAVTYTLASTHGISVGSTAGTAISVKGAGHLTYNGVIADVTAETGAWAKQGGGTLTLGGANTYSGATAVNNGILQLGLDNSLPATTVVSIGQAASSNTGIFDLNSHAQEIAGLNSVTGSGVSVSNVNTISSTGAATLKVSGSGTYSLGDSTNGQNRGVISGAVSLNVALGSAGVQTLGDTDSYTGTTTLSGGKLVVASTGSLSGTSGVTVGGGTLEVDGSIKNASAVTVNGGLLTGSNTVSTGTTVGAVTINSGGSISANSTTSPVGTFLTGAEAWNGGGTYAFDLNNVAGTGTGYDTLNMGANALDISSLNNTTNTFTIAITGYNGSTAGSVASFNNNTNYAWKIASFGSLTGTFDPTDFVINSTGFTNAHTGTFSVVQTGSELDLDYTASIAAKTLTWNPPGTTWDTTGGNQNWLDTTSTAASFSTGDNVNFTDAGLAAGSSVSIDGGGVQPGSTNVSNSTGTYTFTGGAIGGTGGLTKSGGGMLVVSNATNTYAGATTVSGGTLQLGGSNLLPAETDATVAAGATLDLNGNSQTVDSLSGDTTSTGGNVTLGGGTLTVSGAVSTTFAGAISGSGTSTLTKAGAGTLTLTGVNTYAGPTNINGGKLQLSGSGTLPTTTAVTLANAASTSLDINGTTQTVASLSGGGATGGNVTIGAGALTVNGASNTVLGGSLSSTTGSFALQGGGGLEVDGAYTIGGNTTLAGGSTLKLAQANATVNLVTATSGTPFDGSLVVNGLKRLNFNSATTTQSQFIGTAPTTDTIQVQTANLVISNLSGSTAGAVGNNIVLNSNNLTGTFQTFIGGTAGSSIGSATALTFNGVISGASDVIFANNTAGGGAGDLILNGQNTWTGKTEIANGGSATVQLGVDNALPDTDLVVGALANAGAIDMNSHSDIVASLSSSGGHFGTIENTAASTTSVLTINGSNSPSTFVGVVTDGAGAIKLVRAGTGTTELGSTGTSGNLYSGGTDIQGGVLQFDTAIAMPTTGDVSVESGGQLVLNAAATFGDPSQHLTLAGAGVTGTPGALRTGSGLAVVYQAPVAMTADTTISVAGATGQLTLSGGLADNGHTLDKQGAGTLTLPGTSVLTGSLIVGNGTLDASAIAGGFHFGNGQTLSGSGTLLADVHLTAGATLSPGSSPGILGETGDQTWAAGGNYNWQLLDATGAAGVGFDQMAITGTLDLSALNTTTPFDINLWSLASILPDVSGDATNWNNTATQSWIIVTTTGGILGTFDPADFALLTTANDGSDGFSNALGGGSFSLSEVPGSIEGSENLVLTFTALTTPEPTSFVLLAVSGLLIGGRSRNRKRA